MEEVVNLAQSAKALFLGMWRNIIELETVVRNNYINKEIDNEVLTAFISQLLTIWKELFYKVPEDMQKKFEKYKTFYLNPEKLIETPSEIWNLLLLEREAYERLKIMEFEQLPKE